MTKLPKLTSVVLSKHALLRAVQRDVMNDQLAAALKHPTTATKSWDVWTVNATVDSRPLVVKLATPVNKTATVVTVWWADEPETDETLTIPPWLKNKKVKVYL